MTAIDPGRATPAAGGAPARRPASRKSRQRLVLLGLAAMLLAAAWWLDRRAVETSPPQALSVDPRRDPGGHAAEARRRELDERFRQAVVMLHAKQFDHAVTALHRVLELEPSLPEAHVNMGFALAGRGEHRKALAFFDSALRLRPNQVNAYFGMALSHEAAGDLPAAIGAMRTYVHLGTAGDPYRTRALAAIWEWQTALGRVPEQAPPEIGDKQDGAVAPSPVHRAPGAGTR